MNFLPEAAQNTNRKKCKNAANYTVSQLAISSVISLLLQFRITFFSEQNEFEDLEKLLHSELPALVIDIPSEST